MKHIQLDVFLKTKEKFVDYLEDQQFKLDDFFRGKNISITESRLYSLENKGQTPREIKEHIKTGITGYLPVRPLREQ